MTQETPLVLTVSFKFCFKRLQCPQEMTWLCCSFISFIPLFLERPTLVPTEQFCVKSLQIYGPQRRPLVSSSMELPSLFLPKFRLKFRPRVKARREEPGSRKVPRRAQWK